MPRIAPLTFLGNLVAGIALTVTGILYLLFDKLVAISLYPRAIALFIILGLLAAVPFLYGRRRIVQIALPIALLCAMLAVQFVDWDSRKPFLRALHRVEPGMTVSEVDAIMAGYLRSPAQASSADGESVVGYRHTTEGWGDSDIALIRFAGSRVTSREFLPD